MEPHSVRSPTYRRAIKELSKAVHLDWINNQACRLSQNIYVITDLFITNNYLFEIFLESINRRGYYFTNKINPNQLLKKGVPIAY